MMLKVARPTVPPALLYAPNKIATADVLNDATSHGLGKYFSRQIPNGINQVGDRKVEQVKCRCEQSCARIIE